jgi:hypothetical protein
MRDVPQRAVFSTDAFAAESATMCQEASNSWKRTEPRNAGSR